MQQDLRGAVFFLTLASQKEKGAKSVPVAEYLAFFQRHQGIKEHKSGV